MIDVVELVRTFNESPLSLEQAERLAAIRQASSGLAAVLHQGLPAGPWRDEAIRHVRLALALAREAVAVESSPQDTPQRDRRELLAKIAMRDGPPTEGQLAALTALLGLLPDDRPKRKRA